MTRVRTGQFYLLPEQIVKVRREPFQDFVRVRAQPLVGDRLTEISQNAKLTVLQACLDTTELIELAYEVT
jgi:hypothetical protein